MKTTGIYFTDNALIIYSIRETAEGKVVFDEKIALPGSDRTAAAGALRSFFSGHDLYDVPVRCAVPRRQAFFRFLTLPSADYQELRKMAGYNMPDLFPASPEEMLFDVVPLSTDDKGYSKVMLAAVPRADVIGKMEILKDAGVIASSLTLSTSVLQTYFSEKAREYGSVLCIHIEGGLIDFLVIEKAGCVFSRGVKFSTPGDKAVFSAEFSRTVTALSLEQVSFSGIIISGTDADAGSYVQTVREMSGLPVEQLPPVSIAGILAQEGQTPLPGPPKPDFLPREYTLQKTRDQRRRTLCYSALLVLLNIIVLANIFSVRIKQKSAYLAALQAEIKKIEPSSQVLQKKNIQLGALNRSYVSGRFTLGILSEIYRLAPEGMLLSSLDISGVPGSGKILMTGGAGRTDQVLQFSARLKQSGMFSSVNVDSVETHDESGTAGIDFQMSAGF